MRYDALRMDIVISCSASKLSVPATADRIYTGPLWQTWREHRPERLPNGWRLWALSALHGLVRSDRVLEPYDHVLTPAAVPGLAARIATQWNGIATGVVVIGGKLYQEAVTRHG